MVGQKTKFLALALSVLAFAELHGQTERLRFEHLTVEDGLSQSTIFCIWQDRKGFMWFGTSEGLNRYDGYVFQIYHPKFGDSSSLSNNGVTTVCEDREGTLWFGTESGLNHHNRDFDTFQRFTNRTDDASSLSNNAIRSLHVDAAGRLWVGTEMGLNRFVPESDTFVHYMHDPRDEMSLSNNYVCALVSDKSGKLWIGTQGGGLNQLDLNTGKAVRFPVAAESTAGLSNNNVRALLCNDDGSLWIATDDGLNKFEPARNQWTVYRRDPSKENTLSHNTINVLMRDTFGTLWVGTDDGLDRVLDNTTSGDHLQSQASASKQNLNGNDISVVRHTSDMLDLESLSGSRIRSIFQDSVGGLWVGSHLNGLNKATLVKKKFKHYKPDPRDANSLSFNTVRSFLKDNKGKVWIGTQGGGLDRFDPETSEFKHHVPSLNDPFSISSLEIFAICQDPDGMFWLGTYGGGLDKFDPETGKAISYLHDPQDDSSLSHNDIRSILPDESRVLWIGTDGGGLDRFDRKTQTFTHYIHDPSDDRSLSSNRVWKICRGSSGVLWLATFGGGLNKFDPATGKVMHYRHNPGDSNSLSYDHIIALLIDNAGIIWIGTDGGGLNRFDPWTSEFRLYTKEDGLPSGTIYGMLEDDNDHLWISNNDGLTRFNKTTGICKNFTAKDGLQSNEFNGGAAYRDSRGFMYFGGINGFNVFHPDSIQDSRYQPPVVLTDFKLQGVSVPVGEVDGRTLLEHTISETKALTLSHRDYAFSLEFAAPYFAASHKILYSYCMEGFDPEWNKGSRRIATYTNVPPGDYTFRVRATNDDGVWNTNGASLKITITPPVWQTWWFRTVAGLMIVLTVVGIYNARVHSLRKRHVQLEHMVACRTAELEQALLELQETRSELVEKAHKAGMADIATGVLHNVGNILNSINTSAAIIQQQLETSKIFGFYKANAMLRKNIDDLGNFLTNDSKGKKLVKYYLKLEELLQEEHAELVTGAQRVVDNIAIVNDVITAQQSVAKADFLNEKLSLAEIVEHTIQLQSGSILRHDITVETHFDEVPEVLVQKTKLIHILLNLYKNAKEAMAEVKQEDRKLVIRIFRADSRVLLSVTDSGSGISENDLATIFTHGFTTKDSGHGFGLHSCANYMSEMGGDIWVESDGINKGATFTLAFHLSDNAPQEIVHVVESSDIGQLDPPPKR